MGGEWNVLGSLPLKRYRFDAVTVGDTIYLIGGQSPSTHYGSASHVLQSVDAFNKGSSISSYDLQRQITSLQQQQQLLQESDLQRQITSLQQQLLQESEWNSPTT